MAKTAEFPANISYTLLVHAGSYKDFLNQLNTHYTQLKIMFVKKIAIHYYIVQVEDRGEKDLNKKTIYQLPIMAMREEFSNYVFFKNTKSYNNVLKRMCNAKENPNASYDLLQHMMTPFEKSKMIDLEAADSVEFIELNAQNEEQSITYYDTSIRKMEVLNKLFDATHVKINKEEKIFIDLIKTQNWKIGICK